MTDGARKACFIIPYFGKLPGTMPAYLLTCRRNPDFDWMIVTDDETPYDYPPNVHCIYTSFDSFVQRVQSCFDFKISLNKPYKICDFRAAFGVIFGEELKTYRFWGHCDLDQYFGQINHFITDEILDSHDKILCLGHFTLFRNTSRINHMYQISDKKWGQSYRDAFTQEKHWIFDEWPADNTSINRIMKQERVKTFYQHDAFCDLVPFVSSFRRYLFDHGAEKWTEEPIRNSVFVWDNGVLYRCCGDGKGGVIRQEMLYVHIRQRKMDCLALDSRKNAMVIVPNRIISYDSAQGMDVKKLLRRATVRAMGYPDERARKMVIFRGYVEAGKRKIRKLHRN